MTSSDIVSLHQTYTLPHCEKKREKGGKGRTMVVIGHGRDSYHKLP